MIEEVSDDDLEAAGIMLDELMAGTFYENHEKALNQMFGTSNRRIIYVPERSK